LKKLVLLKNLVLNLTVGCIRFLCRRCCKN
jgi:hypothetical protein